jgi:signal transduction histidine kinase/ActR/RegA family two-component response regulator
MTQPIPEELQQRVIVLAPTGKDGALTCTLLTNAGIHCTAVTTIEDLVTEAERGAGVLLVAEETISNGGPKLIKLLTDQPQWSDLPVLIVTRQGADSAAVVHAVRTMGNVSLLERPTRVATLISAARAALRARQKQYQIRDHLTEREQAAAALRDTDRRKDEFLATLAHELRNPMAPISNSIHVLRLTSGESPAVVRVCEMMERQVNHMVRLVDDLLDLSRITRGKIELRKELIELTAVIRSAVETSEPLISARGHQLTIELPPGPLTLSADLVRLSQVFSNLLNNAAKYMNEGGDIHLTARREGSQVTVSVKDSGIGIPPPMLSGIFEMFTQVDRTLGVSQGGLGIGLTLVKSLVQMHGGTVEARSEGADRGTEFIVALPLAEETADDPPCHPLSGEPAFQARRVLVVDDNRDAANSLGSLLRILGATVYVVHDGPSALREFAAIRPDIVLLDIGMPGMDGHEVIRRIKQMPASKGVTMVALTGWGQTNDRQRTRAEGFDHHLTKPLDIQELHALVQSLDLRRNETSQLA